MLEFKSVTKRFGDIIALEGVSFEIPDGEFVLVIGPSGAGKTSILRLVMHEFAPTEGEIFLDEIAIHNLKRSQVPNLRQQVGAVFQDFKLLTGHTISENISLALAVKGVPASEWDERVFHVGELVGIGDRLNLFPSQLSGGELQRASIARALVTNPKIIFADEPTGNLDWETAEGIMKLLSKINEEGKTVIVTTHNRDIIKEHKGRVLEVKKGKLVSDTNTKKKHNEKAD